MIIFRLIEMFSPLSLPLLLGVLTYFRLRRYQKFLAHLVGFILPPILTFYFIIMVMNADFARMEAKYGRPTCGMPALAAVMLLFAGTGIQILFSLAAQLVLYTREQIKSSASSG